MIYTPPSVSFEAVTDFGVTGLSGTLTVAITDNLANYVLAPTTGGIFEFPLGSGIYYVTLTAPSLLGQYTVIWDDGGMNVAVEDMTVTADAPIMVIGAPGSALGPISGWITTDDVAACCETDVSTDNTVLENAVKISQELLFQLSGRIFPGIGSRTVRPCRTRCGFWPTQVLSRGHIVWPDWAWGGGGWWWGNGAPCGCRHLSTVHLAGYPVQSITSVLIDGATVDPATYELVRHRELVRVRDPADPDTMLLWPSCQALDLPDTEVGTFSVTYLFGQNPPDAGIAAAVELACEVFKLCNGEECALPKNTTRVSRQGVTIEKPQFATWGFQQQSRGGIPRGWQTGMPAVDMFLNAYAQDGVKRRPVFWSPAVELQYAQPEGT